MPRTLLIFGLCLPLAVLMGFMLADPLMSSSMAFVGAMIFMLLLPIALAAHHTALIWVAGAYANAFVLPGQPEMWMIIAVFSFGISVLSRPLAKNKVKPVWPASVAAPLIMLLVVVIVTARATGGIGVKALGSQVFGGRKYIWILAAVFGFFALSFQTVPRHRARRDTAAFCLSPMTAGISNLAYMLGPGFYFLYLLFPAGFAVGQASADMEPAMFSLKRLSGFGPASIGLASFCLMRYGIRGLFRLNQPTGGILFFLAMVMGLLSGFRSAFAIVAIVFAVQFFAEGLHKTRWAFGVLAALLLVFGLLAAFASSLPLAAQRAISFLPVHVDAAAASDAESSVEWRLNMWKIVAKDIPKYFWLGKGYAMDPRAVMFIEESVRRGIAEPYDSFIQSGDYHSGPLSVIIPFGIFGVLSFLWFCAAGLQVLWRNMCYGDLDLKRINTYLFSFFVGRLIFFFVFFGGFEVDLWLFCSIVGLSLSLNGGRKDPPQAPRLQFEKPRPWGPRRPLLAGI